MPTIVEAGRSTPLSRAPDATLATPALGESFGRIGTLEVRLARGRGEVLLAQRLRYRVFYEELAAVPSPRARHTRRDEDDYDDICDHLVVVDHAASVGSSAIVGTYRILRGEAAGACGMAFYSSREFDLSPLLHLAGCERRLMEVGRSCVLATHRKRATLELLWHGLWTYTRRHGIDVMLGCASFEGCDPARHGPALAYLHRHHLAPPPWRCRALPEVAADLDPAAMAPLTPRAAMRDLPPLIKGYLRLGAWVGDGAVIDRQFSTVDVLIVLPVERIDARYFARFGAPGESESRLARNSGTATD